VKMYLKTFVLSFILLVSANALGGWTKSNDLNLDNPVYQTILGSAMTQLASQNSGFAASGWKVTKILSVETQVVSGVNYKMTVELTSADGATQEMELTIYYQPWTKTIQLTNSVTLPSPNTTFLAQDEEVGAYSPDKISQNSPILEQVLQTGLDNLNKDGEDWTIQNVISVDSQLVAGTNYRVVVEVTNKNGQPATYEWTVYCSLSNECKVTSSEALLNSFATTGGWTSGNINDAEVQDAVSAAMTKLTSSNGLLASGDWQVSKVMSVETQVVAGVNYKILAQVQDATGQTQNIVFNVYYQPWTNSYTLESYQVLLLSGNSRLLQTAGGWKKQSPDSNDAGLQIAIDTALNTLQSENGVLSTSEGTWSCTKVISVETQVVAGTNYRVTAEFTNSETGESKIVTFVVFEQPWTNTNQLTSYEVVETKNSKKDL